MKRPALKSAKLPVQKALVSRVEAALDAAGVDCGVTTDPGPRQSYPYLEVGDDEERERYTASTTGSDLSHTLRIRSRSSVEAKRIASLVVEAVMEEDIALGQDHYMMHVELEQNTVMTERRPNGRSSYTASIRFGYQIGQH
jgi:hypothetical protein